MPAELATTLTSTEADRLMQAEALVRGFCGWHIAPSRKATVTLRGTTGPTLMLPSLYVTEITSVTVDDSLTDAADYYEFQAGYLTRPSGWWTAERIVVEFTHGYEDVPADVTAIVQAVAQRAIANPGSLKSKSIGPFSESYSLTSSDGVTPLTLLDSEKEALRRYRIPALG